LGQGQVNPARQGLVALNGDLAAAPRGELEAARQRAPPRQPNRRPIARDERQPASVQARVHANEHVARVARPTGPERSTCSTSVPRLFHVDLPAIYRLFHVFHVSFAKHFKRTQRKLKCGLLG
jgi:hypothetical protein